MQGTIRQARLNVEESGEFANALRTVPWCDPDRKSLLSCVAEVAASGPAGRRDLQDFKDFTNHVPQALWEAMKSDRAIAIEKLISHALAVGLRNPTEPSVQLMTSILLLCTEGEAGARSLQPPALH